MELTVTEPVKKNLHTALLEAQKKIEAATKDATNPHHGKTYATLAAIINAVKKPLNDAGIFVRQKVGRDADGSYVETILTHAETGETDTSKIYMIVEKQSMQALGSAITYAKRYDLSMFLFVATEDDDGNAANPPPKNNKKENHREQNHYPQNLPPMRPRERDPRFETGRNQPGEIIRPGPLPVGFAQSPAPKEPYEVDVPHFQADPSSYENFQVPVSGAPPQPEPAAEVKEAPPLNIGQMGEDAFKRLKNKLVAVGKTQDWTPELLGAKIRERYVGRNGLADLLPAEYDDFFNFVNNTHSGVPAPPITFGSK